jgi:hypothetical protein
MSRPKICVLDCHPASRATHTPFHALHPALLHVYHTLLLPAHLYEMRPTLLVSLSVYLDHFCSGFRCCCCCCCCMAFSWFHLGATLLSIRHINCLSCIVLLQCGSVFLALVNYLCPDYLSGWIYFLLFGSCQQTYDIELDDDQGAHQLGST